MVVRFLDRQQRKVTSDQVMEYLDAERKEYQLGLSRLGITVVMAICILVALLRDGGPRAVAMTLGIVFALSCFIVCVNLAEVRRTLKKSGDVFLVVSELRTLLGEFYDLFGQTIQIHTSPEMRKHFIFCCGALINQHISGKHNADSTLRRLERMHAAALNFFSIDNTPQELMLEAADKFSKSFSPEHRRQLMVRIRSILPIE